MLQEDVTLGMGAVQAPGGIICKFGAGAGMAWLVRSVADAPSHCDACDFSPTTAGRSVGRPEGRQRLLRAS
jgi:hypothetical protein